MTAENRISFPVATVQAVPYRGPLYRVRPFVKWVLLFCWIAYFGVVVLLLQGDTILGGLRACAVPTAVSAAWLYATRTRYVRTSMKMELYFGPDSLTAYCEDYPITSRYDEPGFQQVRQSVGYREIRCIRYQCTYHQLEIYGPVHTVNVKTNGGVPEPHPCFGRGQKGAVINLYLPPEQAEEIIAAVCRGCGRPLDSVERYGIRQGESQ